MKSFYYFFIVIILAIASCTEQTDQVDKPAVFVDTATVFKKEIPASSNGIVDLFYSLAKTKQQQLGLDSLEKGFTNLQIRIWYDFSLVKERKLVVIKNKEADWTATVYDLQVNWDGNTETIVSKKVKNAVPKSGWADFSKKLIDSKILTLPDQYNITGYGYGDDGSTYNVEVATKNQYRFYGYWEPRHYQDKFWQAKCMTNILELLEEELGV